MPFRTAMLALRNQKCRVYDDVILIDEPKKKKAAVAYEMCSIESPTRIGTERSNQ